MVSRQTFWQHLQKQSSQIFAYINVLDAYKPAERQNAYIWDYVADACTMVQIAISIVYISQPTYDDPDAERWFRYAHCQILARISAPLGKT